MASKSVLAVIGFLLATNSFAASAPTTVAQIALYQGADREKILVAGAKREGLTEDLVDRIRDDWAERGLAPRHQAALRAVDAFHDDAGALDDAARRALLDNFTSAEIVELGAGIALFLGFSKIAVALGGLPDEIPVHEQPTPDVPAGA